MTPTAPWPKVVLEVGKWYEANVHEYRAVYAPKGDPHHLAYKGCGSLPDCTGYVSMCLQLYGAFKKQEVHGTAEFAQINGTVFNILKNNGFTPIPYNINKLQPYDIMCVYESKAPAGEKRLHHVEIYAGNGKSWSWGNVHDGIGKHHGMPSPMAKYRYNIIYRCNGLSLDMINTSYDFSFSNSELSGSTGLYNIYQLLQNKTSLTYYHDDNYAMYRNQYPDFFSNTDANKNSLTLINITELANNMINTTTKNIKTLGRVYSTNDAKIVLDELSLPINNADDIYISKGLSSKERAIAQSNYDKTKIKDLTDNKVTDIAVAEQKITSDKKES